MDTTEHAARAFVPEVGRIDPFNTEVIGRAASWRQAAESAQDERQAPSIEGQFDEPVEFTRHEWHDGQRFSIMTRHHSQASLNAERAQWGVG